MRAIKLNYDVVLTIFAEPSLWRAKIFEKNQDDPKNKNHKSTCTALKPISVIRKKENTFYYLSFSFESNIFYYFFLLKSISCSLDPTGNSKIMNPNCHELFWPTRTSFPSLVCLLFSPKTINLIGYKTCKNSEFSWFGIRCWIWWAKYNLK